MRTLPALLVTLLLALAPLPTAADDMGETRVNPCAAKTLNPCAAKTLNPCAAKSLNPCAAKTSNPCSGANPCAGANPCGGAGVSADDFVQPQGVELAAANPCLVKRGEALWNDRSLGKSGLACSTCHVGGYGQMNASFAKPYPHRVAMPKQQAGVDQVNAAEMVNFCMIVPMADEPLAWDSAELAALAAYVQHIQPGFQANPCAMKNNVCAMKANPCAMKKNVCAMNNACAMKANPCAMKANPCAMKANPCAMKTNPCNPCGGH